MKKIYTNPCQHLGQLDEITFNNIEKVFENYLLDALNDLEQCKDNKTEYFKIIALIIKINNDYGDFYLKNNFPTKAIDKYLETLGYIKQVITDNVDKNINVLEAMKAKITNIYIINKEYDKAINFNEYYLDYYKELTFVNEKFKNTLIGMSKYNLGKCYYDASCFDDCEKNIDEALQLLNENNINNNELIANVYLYKARIKAKKNLVDEADSFYQFVFDEIKTLNEKSIMRLRLVDIKNEYGDFLFKNFRLDDALSCYMDMVEIIGDKYTNTPNQTKFYVGVLFRIGKIHEQNKNFQQSYNYYKKGYEIYKNLEEVNQDVLLEYRLKVANTAHELRNYNVIVQMLSENINYLKSKANISVKDKELLCQSYLRQSIIKEKQKDTEGAFLSCLEAFNVVNQLRTLNEIKYENMYLDLKNSLSNFYFNRNDLSKSEVLCLELIDESSNRKGPAANEFLASILERLVKIYTNSNYTDGLIENYLKLIDIYKNANLPRHYIGTIERYANILYQNEEYNKGINYLEEILNYISTNINDEKEITFVSALTLRKICLWVRKAKKANYPLDKEHNLDELYSRCEGMYMNLMKISGENSFANFCDMYIEWESFLAQSSRFNDALEIAQRNLEMLEDYKYDTEKYYHYLSMINQRIGTLLSFLNRFDQSIEYLDKSIEIYESINVDGKFDNIVNKMKKNREIIKNKKNN